MGPRRWSELLDRMRASRVAHCGVFVGFLVQWMNGNGVRVDGAQLMASVLEGGAWPTELLQLAEETRGFFPLSHTDPGIQAWKAFVIDTMGRLLLTLQAWNHEQRIMEGDCEQLLAQLTKCAATVARDHGQTIRTLQTHLQNTRSGRPVRWDRAPDATAMPGDDQASSSHRPADRGQPGRGHCPVDANHAEHGTLMEDTPVAVGGHHDPMHQKLPRADPELHPGADPVPRPMDGVRGRTQNA